MNEPPPFRPTETAVHGLFAVAQAIPPLIILQLIETVIHGVQLAQALSSGHFPEARFLDNIPPIERHGAGAACVVRRRYGGPRTALLVTLGRLRFP